MPKLVDGSIDAVLMRFCHREVVVLAARFGITCPISAKLFIRCGYQSRASRTI
jgi:hypothetical protein